MDTLFQLGIRKRNKPEADGEVELLDEEGKIRVKNHKNVTFRSINEVSYVLIEQKEIIETLRQRNAKSDMFFKVRHPTPFLTLWQN